MPSKTKPPVPVIGERAEDVPDEKPITRDALVRYAAQNLADAITDARKAGYVVNLPFPIESLGRIAISETGKVSG